MNIELADIEAQLQFGAQLAALLPPTCVLYLEGDLGTGKTTLARSILRQLGHSGAVRSPTYTLLEPYQLADRVAYHLDLYRLTDAEELEYLGLRDLLGENALWMIEWAERGVGHVPPADIRIQINHLPVGRHLTLRGMTPSGEVLVATLRDVGK
ncbi:tRNA (adenosine(37)-N6)-threonylcarbamoyltransferase complex ATPase subunit type 1 TsaE [Chromatium okenii]|uniref:tRNA (adenosine(37)-N6)-threonylcarbamoyltransferase complex ATPase subunit type 1 TsaE n=1 Tax=Chromatium okenii TaxID=61644 RepID=UPI0026EBF76D|nr:tRNA (adenosine(37)-N6)-threonylcarbamoyltransferase complex ATPase subunit type 1 TsaE [Chromatium okenii]MBV5308954.1 tRNA (adenosine(37)-N6)-threonylcarbamoyltransferase complex ATPase subunit type 1 TsaE [Chromatium okenii]